VSPQPVGISLAWSLRSNHGSSRETDGNLDRLRSARQSTQRSRWMVEGQIPDTIGGPASVSAGPSMCLGPKTECRCIWHSPCFPRVPWAPSALESSSPPSSWPPRSPSTRSRRHRRPSADRPATWRTSQPRARGWRPSRSVVSGGPSRRASSGFARDLRPRVSLPTISRLASPTTAVPSGPCAPTRAARSSPVRWSTRRLVAGTACAWMEPVSWPIAGGRIRTARRASYVHQPTPCPARASRAIPPDAPVRPTRPALWRAASIRDAFEGSALPKSVAVVVRRTATALKRARRDARRRDSPTAMRPVAVCAPTASRPPSVQRASAARRGACQPVAATARAGVQRRHRRAAGGEASAPPSNHRPARPATPTPTVGDSISACSLRAAAESVRAREAPSASRGTHAHPVDYVRELSYVPPSASVWMCTRGQEVQVFGRSTIRHRR